MVGSEPRAQEPSASTRQLESAACNSVLSPQSSVVVTPVTDGRDLDSFIKFPWSTYRGDRNWVPPIISQQQRLFDRRHHPFHEHGNVQLFLARGGSLSPPSRTQARRVVGRIAAIANHAHNRFHGDRVGFFGFFECIDSVPVARALLAAAAGWARAQGLDTMRGPASFSTNEECGLLIEGFDSSPVLMMTYNPPYYARLLEACGLTKAKDLLAYHISRDTVFSPRVARLERMVERVRARGDVRVRHFDLRNFDAELVLARQVYNHAWESNWGFVPMTDEEFQFMGRQFKQVAEPELVLLAETVPEGRPVGFALTLPDWNVAIRRINGRLWPLGLPILLWYGYTRKLKRLRLVALGVVHDYHRRGVDALLLWETLRRGVRRGFDEAEFSWILEDNALMINAAEAFGLRCYKRYRMYEGAVDHITAGVQAE